MCKLLPALQKFYNALKHLKQFSANNSLFDNIGDLDVFLSEYRSVTLVLQTSLGGNNDLAYQTNLKKYLLKDTNVAKWLNDERVAVIHRHPFKLKKIIRVVVYHGADAVEFKRIEHTIGNDNLIDNYKQLIRNTFLSIVEPEVSFSVQYVFLDEDDLEEHNIFDLIDPGVTSMWMFLHAMKEDLCDKYEVSTKLMNEIDDMVMSRPRQWVIDAVDYTYYRSTDSFERGQLFTIAMPEIRYPKSILDGIVKGMRGPVSDFFEAFVWIHSLIYIQQRKKLMPTFFVEYEDDSYQIITFAATIRTTMYRYVNRIACMVEKENIKNVYFVTEFIGYVSLNKKTLNDFLQLNYREREAFQTRTYLSFYQVSSFGKVSTALIDANDLVDRLSISSAIGKIKTEDSLKSAPVVITPILKAFRSKLNKNC